MKKLILIFCIVIFFNLFAGNSHAVTQTTEFNIKYIGQDPSPAVPGKYVDLTFSAKGGKLYSPSEVTFSTVQRFPFSLEPGESSTKTLGTVNVIGEAAEENDILFNVRLLIDSKAIEGDNELEYKYTIGGFTFSKRINITISSVRTDFDVIVQEVSGNSVSLGIVNIGKNSARSVIVTIPEQKNFGIVDVDSSIIGNLAGGDFTVTTFKILPRTSSKSDLKVLVSYTDTEGTRYTLEKSVSLKLNPEVAASVKNKNLEKLNSPLIFVGLILVIIVLAYLAFFKKKR